MTLKTRLSNYIRRKGGWVSSGHLQRLVAEKTQYTPQNVGRRLRELQNEGILIVHYEKNHAFYKYKGGEDVLESCRKMCDEFDKYQSTV